ncbi:hypothetical protein P008_02949 [Enterococcus faecalis EnGen0408]|nr:hypothetical protein P008_02949 [Enterococcus faecalis EnGen0408]
MEGTGRTTDVPIQTATMLQSGSVAKF